jgi:hypothetical protein
MFKVPGLKLKLWSREVNLLTIRDRKQAATISRRSANPPRKSLGIVQR